MSDFDELTQTPIFFNHHNFRLQQSMVTTFGRRGREGGVLLWLAWGDVVAWTLVLASVRVPLVKWRCGRRQEESQRHKIFSSIPVQVEGNHFQYGGHGSTRSLELWCSTGRRLLSLLAEWRLHNFGVVPEVPDESSLSGLRIWMSTLPCRWREGDS